LEVLRAFPEIAEKHQQLLQFQRQQILFMLDFNASRGSFMQPTYEAQFAELAQIFCLTMDNWMSYQLVTGNKGLTEDAYCLDLWAILRPLFTDMGIPEFRQLQNKSIGLT